MRTIVTITNLRTTCDAGHPGPFYTIRTFCTFIQPSIHSSNSNRIPCLYHPALLCLHVSCVCVMWEMETTWSNTKDCNRKSDACFCFLTSLAAILLTSNDGMRKEKAKEGLNGYKTTCTCV